MRVKIFSSFVNLVVFCRVCFEMLQIDRAARAVSGLAMHIYDSVYSAKTSGSAKNEISEIETTSVVKNEIQVTEVYIILGIELLMYSLCHSINV